MNVIPMHGCEDCDDTGWVPGDEGMRRCDCVIARVAKRRVGAIPEAYRDKTLDGFDEDGNNTGALITAENWLRSYPDVPRGLFFVGPTGTGKTHLAAALLRAVVDEGADGVFFDYGELLERMRASYGSDDGETDDRIIEPALRAQVLVLDDLGSRRMTAWARDTIEYLISHRYNHCLPTILTTNFGDDTDPTLETRVGGRVRSRLYEMCKTVRLDGPDVRAARARSGRR